MNSEALIISNDSSRQQPGVSSGKEFLMGEDFRIGEWLVEPQLNQIRQLHGNQTRRLEPRLAKLLCCLAAHEMQVLDRDTLVSVLWPRVIVNENSLTRAVSELRKQLSLASRPQLNYIETIPKRGYRLRLPVRRVGIVSADPEATAHLPDLVRQPFPLFTAARQSLTAAVCLSLILGLWLQSERRSVDDTPAARNSLSDELILSPTDADWRDEIVLSSTELPGVDTGNMSQPSLAQDENRFAYIQYDHTGSTLYLGEVDGQFDPVPVFNSSNILFNLAWSPVGNGLIFASRPAHATTTLFDANPDSVAELYSFDLDSFRLSRLVEKSPIQRSESQGNEFSLT